MNKTDSIETGYIETTFVATGIRDIIKVRCGKRGLERDIIDYGSW